MPKSLPVSNGKILKFPTQEETSETEGKSSAVHPNKEITELDISTRKALLAVLSEIVIYDPSLAAQGREMEAIKAYQRGDCEKAMELFLKIKEQLPTAKFWHGILQVQLRNKFLEGVEEMLQALIQIKIQINLDITSFVRVIEEVLRHGKEQGGFAETETDKEIQGTLMEILQLAARFVQGEKPQEKILGQLHKSTQAFLKATQPHPN